MSLNLTQSAAAVLLAQLNTDLGTNYTAEQITFGPLTTNNGPDAALFEVAVQVNGVQGLGPNGAFFYKYNRVDLSAIFTAENSTYSVDGGITFAQLITNINTAMGTNMVLTVLPDNDTNQLYVAGDIMPQALPFPAPGNASVNFMITADANSLIYRNAALLTATTATTSLAAAFVGKTSTGLVYTPPA